MHDDRDERTRGDTAAEDSRLRARRRFLGGGALAAPLVLTLGNRPALAGVNSICNGTQSASRAASLAQVAQITCAGRSPSLWSATGTDANGYYLGTDDGFGGIRPDDNVNATIGVIVDLENQTFAEVLARGDIRNLGAETAAAACNAKKFGAGVNKENGEFFGFDFPDLVNFVTDHSSDPEYLLDRFYGPVSEPMTGLNYRTFA